MKKTTNIICFLFFAVCFSQTTDITEKINYETTTDLNLYADIIFLDTTDKGGLIYVKEKRKMLSSKAYYYFYYYDKNKKLVLEKKLKTNKIDKIFISKDSIYLIRHKKDLFTPKPEGFTQRPTTITGVDFFKQSASLKDFNFKETKWFTVNHNMAYWSKIPKNTNTLLHTDSQNNLIHITRISNPTTKVKINDADISILSNPTKKKERYYNTLFKVEMFDTNLTKVFSKKIISTNNRSRFNVEKIKTDPTNKDIYLLVSTLKDKTKPLIGIKRGLPQYHIIKISPNGTFFKTIGSNKHKLEAVNFDFYKDKIVCTGLYWDTKPSNINGICKLDFNKNTFKEEGQNYLEFTPQFFEDLSFSSKIKTSTKQIFYSNNNFTSDFIHIDKNGNCTINIEEYYVSSNFATAPINGPAGVPMANIPLTSGLSFSLSYSVSSRTSSVSSDSNRNQKKIIAAKISNDNKLLWARAIKDRDGRDFQISQCLNGTNYIIKKDIPRTHKKISPEDKTNSKNNFLYIISINDKGKMNSKRFLSYREGMWVDLISANNIANGHTNFFIERANKEVFQLVNFHLK
ncbi:hypothetical protein [Wenyingzhuangia sp. IMCC45574]